jgi:uncharacterized protein (DUF4213/DUF364 family)
MPANRDNITSRLATLLETEARHLQVADVRIGLGYTAVVLEDDRLGVTFTFRDAVRKGCAVISDQKPLIRRPAWDLLMFMESSNLFEAGVGLACANALANNRPARFRDGDILDHLDLKHTDEVAMVGRFGPLIRPLKQRARSLSIFERLNQSCGELRPAEDAYEVLPRCQVALITATSLITHEIDRLLQSAQGCREVAVLGASTPMAPEAFKSTNVTLMSGVVPEDTHKILRVVSEGGGFRQFKQYVRKVSLRVD